jgi:hypothetical protein
LEKRLFLLKKLTKKIKNDLKEFEIIHKDSEGINVVINFKNEKEKKELIDYCNKSEDEYTSPISKIYKVENEYIIVTENSLYLVSANISTKRIS